MATTEALSAEMIKSRAGTTYPIKPTRLTPTKAGAMSEESKRTLEFGGQMPSRRKTLRWRRNLQSRMVGGGKKERTKLLVAGELI